MHPKKGKDFDILYNELEVWRLNETKKIKGSQELDEEEKRLALQQGLTAVAAQGNKDFAANRPT